MSVLLWEIASKSITLSETTLLNKYKQQAIIAYWLLQPLRNCHSEVLKQKCWQSIFGAVVLFNKWDYAWENIFFT